MGKIGKITPEQLRTAQRILRELPEKDNRCSREEAAAFLEKDFKRAFRKDYTPKELCARLKKAVSSSRNVCPPAIRNKQRRMEKAEI